MSKVLFIPFSIAAGFLAGLLGTKVFEAIWGLVDDEEPPDAQHREVSWPKLILALALQGAIFRAARGIADHGFRRSFYAATGQWPGEEEPEPTV